MFADRVLRNCLLLSIIIHAAVIFNVRPYKIFSNTSVPKELEVTYYKKIGHILPEAFVDSKEKITNSALLDKKKNLLEEKRTTPVDKIRKIFAPSTEKIQVSKAVLTQDKMLISYNSKDLTDNPSYLKYHNLVRAKIERMANANKPYIFRVGEVNLIFTILNSGDLKEVNLVNEGSVTDRTLRQCALDSVYAASPFPPFAGDVKEDHLTLQVTISFEK